MSIKVIDTKKLIMNNDRTLAITFLDNLNMLDCEKADCGCLLDSMAWKALKGKSTDFNVELIKSAKKILEGLQLSLGDCYILYYKSDEYIKGPLVITPIYETSNSGKIAILIAPQVSNE